MYGSWYLGAGCKDGGPGKDHIQCVVWDTKLGIQITGLCTSGGIVHGVRLLRGRGGGQTVGLCTVGGIVQSSVSKSHRIMHNGWCTAQCRLGETEYSSDYRIMYSGWYSAQCRLGETEYSSDYRIMYSGCYSAQCRLGETEYSSDYRIMDSGWNSTGYRLGETDSGSAEGNGLVQGLMLACHTGSCTEGGIVLGMDLVRQCKGQTTRQCIVGGYGTGCKPG